LGEASGTTLGDAERAVAAFVASELGVEATRVVRLDAFTTNAVSEVDAGERRFVVKASALQNALRAEAWAGARAAEAGCTAPPILAFGRLEADPSLSAMLMSRVSGSPIVAGHAALFDVGVALRRLHEVRRPGFGWLAEAVWDERDDFSLSHGSWIGFLEEIVGGARNLAGTYPVAARLADAAAGVVDSHADALAAVEVGSLCHGDLKFAHILVESGRLAAVIDWGDAVVGDPCWDIARLAHRVDPRSVSLLLEGYDPPRSMVDELTWRTPFYGVLWMLVDAIVDHRLGHRADSALDRAVRLFAAAKPHL
jgi:aminoglycoside phosphotransferase (APT) family kinase protein